jgi:hypothetical protein
MQVILSKRGDTPMNTRAKVVPFIAALLLFFVVAGTSHADQDALVQKMTTMNQVAIAAYSNGDFAKAKSQLLAAVALGKKDPELQTHPMMARTFLHLGVLYVDGLEDRAGGVRYFGKALKINPDIEVTEALATKNVLKAFADAHDEGGGSSGDSATETAAAPAAKEPTAREEKAAREREERATREEEKQSAKTAAAEKKKAEAEAKEHERQAEADKDKLMKDLARSGENEAKERAAKEKLAQDKQEKEKALSETKAQLLQAQKERQEADKQALKEKQDTEKQAKAEKDKLGKDLAQIRDSEAKEKAAKEKLTQEKQEKEKALAEAKATIQQLQKEKADKEKQLADMTAREKKEREAKEKLEKEKQEGLAKEKERKNQEDVVRQEREKLAAGPELPGHFSEPVYCAVPDEAQAGVDLFVHCVAKPGVKAKVIALYYRPSGGTVYNSVEMEPSKKGWQAAVIPGTKISGKSLQYYAEARDGRGAVAAANGKAASPNILPLKPASAIAASHKR